MTAHHATDSHAESHDEPRGGAVRALLDEAKRCARDQRMNDALDRLEEAVERAEREPSLLADIAAGLWQLGRVADAADVLERALKEIDSSPNFVTGAERALLLTRLGAARVRLGQFDGALRVLYDALEATDGGYAALQLGNALRYLGEFEEADGHLVRAHNKAKAERDGALAISSLCARGELALDRGDARAAVELFGEALGLTEFASSDALTVPPLAGLAHAHVAWGNPQKAEELARRALERAVAADDTVGIARSKLSLGLALRDAQPLRDAEKCATRAPHQPLALRAMVAQLELEPDDDQLEHALATAKRLGMKIERERLEGIAVARSEASDE